VREKTIGIVCFATRAPPVPPTHLTADQIGSKRRESIRLALRISIFDCHVLAFDVGRFFQALAKRSDLLAQGSKRRCDHEPDHRHRLRGAFIQCKELKT
jgi:hypothetical protein